MTPFQKILLMSLLRLVSQPRDFKFGDVDAGNYSMFLENGTLKHFGDATTWVDVDFPIVVRITGPSIPTLVEVQDGLVAPQWQVNDTNMCEGQEFIHPWKEASELQWHIHMLTNGMDTEDRFVKWEIKWFWCNVNGQVQATLTESSEFTIPANCPDKTMKVVPIYNWTPTGAKIAGHVYCRLTRIPSAGTAPSNNPWCSMLQFHAECDTNGSDTPISK